MRVKCIYMLIFLLVTAVELQISGASDPDTTKVNRLNKQAFTQIADGEYDEGLANAKRALQSAKAISYPGGISFAFNTMGAYYRENEEYEKAIEYFSMSLMIAQAMRDTGIIAKRLGNIGITHWNLGNFSAALDYLSRAYKLDAHRNDSVSMSIRLGNIGLVYYEQANFPKCLEYYLKALKIDEAQGNMNSIARQNGNIGLVHWKQREYDKALTCYFKAAKAYEGTGNKKGLATILGNIGIIYKDRKDYPMALKYYTQAYEIFKKEGGRGGMAVNLGNIGNIYFALAEVELKKSKGKGDSLRFVALDHYLQSLKLRQEIGVKELIATSYYNLGSFYTDLADYRKGFDFLYRAIALSDSIGAMDKVEICYENLRDLYERSTIPLPDTIGGKLLNMEQMRLRALYYQRRFIAVRDLLFSEDSEKELVRKEMNYEFEKKEAVAKAEQDKKDALVSEEKKRQYILLALMGFVALAIGVVAFVIFRSLRVTRAQKAVIEEQKHLVEEKQKEILDSIYYARRIQRTLLPREGYISKHLARLS